MRWKAITAEAVKTLLRKNRGSASGDAVSRNATDAKGRSMRRDDLVLHLLFLAMLLALGGIRVWYYRTQRRGIGLVALKKQETLNEIRQIGAMLACLVIVAHVLRPELFAWTEFPLYESARWIGAVIAVLAIAASWFAARDELVLARRASRERFDPPGLFRWVRHPLELALVGVAVGLTLLSANWVVALLAGALATHEVLVRAPRVERDRRARMGDAYEAYARITPAFFPRPFRASSPDVHEAD